MTCRDHCKSPAAILPVLESDIDALSAELARFEQIDRPQLISLMQAGIAMDLLFRTDEYVLADTTGGRFTELAGAVAEMKDVRGAA